MIKLNDILNEGSAMKAIINAKKGAKASGGGYSSWTKIGNNSWKNKKTGRLSHNAGLYDRIGEFSDFVIEGKLTEDFSQRARNFRVILRQRMKDLKKGGKILAYKMTFTKVGDNKFNWNGKQLWDTEAVVRKIKLAAVKDIMGWKQGARGAPMVKAFLTIKEGKLNEDRFGHPITALGNQIYIQLDKMEQKLSGKEKNKYMRARSAFWKITKAAMEDEEQK